MKMYNHLLRGRRRGEVSKRVKQTSIKRDMKPLNEKQSEFLYLVVGNEEQGPFFSEEDSVFSVVHSFERDLSLFDTGWCRHE